LNRLNQVGLNALFVTLHPSAKKHYHVNDRLKHFDKFFNNIGITHFKIDEQLKNGHIESNVDWNGMRLRVMANDWSKQGNSRAGTMSFLNTSTTRTSPCVRPLREFTISYTGQVFPCCQFFPDDEMNEKYVVDNIACRNIFEIYASPTLATWRKSLFTFGEKKSPCGSCRDEDFSKVDSVAIRQNIINNNKDY
jgi:radical SAM protein with 4Fe4S-binding SPASM domain